ncbi:MAG: hypothetical protein J6O71_06455 [Lachnospiraceae bacterium]|nr:hypothetical protein [Lachnospiraceae bacterium]
MAPNKDPDIQIAYQNKDILTKSFGERLKGKSLGVYGLNGINVVDVLPTNLPAVEANELRLDNLFLLSTGEFAIVDYESEYSEENKSKYLGYIARVESRLYNDFKEYKPLKIIVIYTADVARGTTNPRLYMGDVKIDITEAFLIDLDSKEIRDTLTRKIRTGERFTDEDLMKLVIYPLTYRGKEGKQKAVSEAIDIADDIGDERMVIDAMMGILVFSDKVITKEDVVRIRRRISMTKFDQIIAEEREEAVKAAVKEAVKEAEYRKDKEADQEKMNIALSFLKDGDTTERVARCVGLPLVVVEDLALKI